MFCVINVFSQNIQLLNRQIIWNNNILIEQSTENFTESYYLNFENAVYNNNLNILPYYSEQIFLSENYFVKEDVEIKLVNQKFIAFENSEISKVNFLDELKSEIEFDYDVFQNRGKSYLILSFIPVKKNLNQYLKLLSFDIEIKYSKSRSIKTTTENVFASNSVLSTGTWVKIKVQQDGVYKLTYEQLQQLGFVTPSNVRVFGNSSGMLPFNNNELRTDDLIENKIYKGSDFILFYAKSPNIWKYIDTTEMFLPTNHLYSNYSYYFLTDKNTGWDNSVINESQTNLTATENVNSYDYFINHEIDTFNVLNGGRRWYGEIFEYSSNQDFEFTFPDLISGSNIKINVSAIARSSSSSTFNISSTGLNKNIVINAVSGDYMFARSQNVFNNFTAPNSNSLNVNINFSGSASAKGWLDFIVLNARCNLSYKNSQLIFRDKNSVATGKVSNFSVSNTNSYVNIWDITEPTQPKLINSTFSGSAHSFKLETSVLREFVAFEGENVLTPILEGSDLGTVTNQNLHSASGDIDMVILTYPEFLTQAEDIAEIHRTHDNMNINVVTTTQVYNEFSSGAPDVSAIKYYVKMIYDRAEADTLKYLLLLGDGSYINKGNYNMNTNWILTYQSEESLCEFNVFPFVTDDYFGLLDDNEGEFKGLLDIGIGRMPVKTSIEASEMVEKIRSYLDNNTMKDWRNTICFIADDEDGGLHMNQTERLATKIDTLYPFFNIKKIYIDAYKQEVSSIGDSYPDATEAISNRIEQGALIVNYTGHGSPDRLTHEAVVTIPDIKNWNNFEKLPLFITATCEFSRYDDYSQEEMTEATSAGEFVFLNPHGGGIAMITTTRLVYSGANETLNKNFYKYAFEKNSSNQRYRLGDMIRNTKNDTPGSNSLNFTLLGDPALEIPYAEFNINTTKINNIDITMDLDTMKALSKITVEGEVTDLSNNILQNFNGVVYPSVYDKVQELTTLDNDGIGAINYSSQNNILYKGKASVNNGKFEFSFIVPKDIMYNYGNGKLSYYATNQEIDAKGYFTDFIIGGTSTDFEIDNTPPEIKLFMNDENFVSGSITDPNPIIYSLLYDSSGVNTVGNGIGHDITAIIDGNTNDTKILNNFYEADLDSYQSGKIMYNLYKLDAGNHKVKLKVWDVYNNSTTEEIDFIVVESEELTIERLYNYPNPFTTHTSFYFEHNMPEINLDVLIQIFTVSGKLVKTIETPMFTDGYKSDAIDWDGLDDFGSKIGKGVYIYRVRVKTPSDKVIEKFEKLLILK